MEIKNKSDKAENFSNDCDAKTIANSKFANNPSTEKLFANLRGGVEYYEDPCTLTTEEWEQEI